MTATRDIRQRLLVVCGPTATGKTALGIGLARRLGGEIVNADSRQVYRYLDIGTARPAPAQRAAVPHHLLDFVDPDAPFTLADYLAKARNTIAQIARRGRLPIVVGGTGLYVRALAQGFAVPRVAPNPTLRAELEALAETEGNAALLARLRRIDPAVADRIDPDNGRRLIRAIEIGEATDKLLPAPSARQETTERYDALLLGLTAERTLLHERADRRVDAMMAAGFLQEVAALYDRGYHPALPALSGLGYRELGEHLRGTRPLDDAVQGTKWATHRFIRRQLTWFRREPGLRWIDLAGGDTAVLLQALDLAGRWLASQDPATPAVSV